MSKQDDEGDFDERGVLKDGRSLHVPTFLMDGKPQGVAITDAGGSLRGLHRPGWRIQSSGNVGDELVREGARMDRAEIYALYDAEKSREYQTFGSSYRSGPGEWRGPQEGDQEHSTGACNTCSGSGECPDCAGSGVRAGARQTGWIEEDNGDRDREVKIERITRAATTHSESTPPPRFDGMTLDQLRARHVEQMGREYAFADVELANAWRKQ